MADVPSPIDFQDPAQARVWAEAAAVRRPHRPQLFAAFVAALNARFASPVDVMELGSGPGHLAERILTGCSVRRYVALDFSDAMHALARERLGALAGLVTFETRDFRDSGWGEGLGRFDAVVTLQAAHEMRHKRHLTRFLTAAGDHLREGGVLLYGDHYAGEGKHPDLFVERADQPGALRKAGFVEVNLVRDEGGIALYEARR